MSFSALYAVSKTKARSIGEFRNSHGTAPLIWDYLCQQFLGKERGGWLFGDNSALWALQRDERVHMSVRMTLCWTCDGAICPTSRLAELVTACEDTGKICAVNQHVNHWQALADAIKAHKPRGTTLGLGLSCTSVCDPWSGFPRGEFRGKPWSLFDALTAK